MDNRQDFQYNIDFLSRDQQIDIMQYAKSICSEWWVDELCCSKSWARKKIEMSWKDAIDYFRNAKGFCYFSVIKRRFTEPCYFEIGYRLDNGSRDLFLWINISEDAGDDLINEYSLKRRC